MRPPRPLAILALLIVGGVAWWNATRLRVQPQPTPAMVEQATTPPVANLPAAVESRTDPRPEPAASHPAEALDPPSADEPPPPKVNILVVDAGGAPQAGVPVATVNVDRHHWQDWRGVSRGLTGPEGIAQVGVGGPPGQLAPSLWEYAPQLLPAKCVVAVLAIPIDPPVFQSFDPHAIPDAPIRLVLPPTAGVRIQLRKPDGSAFAEPAKVTVALAGSEWPLADGTRTVEADAVAGSVLVPRVGLTPELKVEVKPGSAAHRPAAATIPAPREPSVETVATITCGESPLLVNGRLVTPEGEPVRRSFAYADVCGGSITLGTPGRTMEAWTNDAGRFALRFDVGLALVAKGEIRLEIPFRRPDKRPERATIRLPETIEGPVDAGDVVVSEPALLATGVVVDDAGHPVAEAEVRHVEGGSQRPFAPAGVSDANGRFELRGATLDKSLVITAVSRGWACLSPTRCERGAQDVRVVVTPEAPAAGSIRGSFGGDLGFRCRPPVQVFAAGPGESAEHPVIADRFYERCFWLMPLVPGRYSVRFVCPGAREPVLVVNDVIVVAGEQNQDPRLEHVDLGRFLKALTVRVVDEQQQPVADAIVGTRGSADAQGSFADFETGNDGRADVMLAPGAVDIVVVRYGYRAAVLTGITDDVTVTLEKAATRPLTIKVADDVALPGAPFQLEASVRYFCSLNDSPRRKADWTDPRHRLNCNFPALARSTELAVSQPGLFEVELWLYHVGPSGKQYHGERCAIPQIGGNAIVTVSESGHSSITVTPDAEALRHEIARWKAE